MTYDERTTDQQVYSGSPDGAGSPTVEQPAYQAAPAPEAPEVPEVPPDDGYLDDDEE